MSDGHRSSYTAAGQGGHGEAHSSTSAAAINEAASNSNFEIFKMVIASIVVTLLIIVDIVGIANRFCILQLHPALNFFLLIGALILLAYVEALHYACVAVEKWDMKQYEEKYPRAVKCQALVNNPEKVKKFLVGRQFFVIFVVFLIAEITAFPYMPSDFGGMPPALLTILVKTGLPGIALVLTFGQLVSQIFVEEYTVPFLNLIGCEFCIRLALAAEYIGICHFSWLLYNVSSLIFCGKVRKLQRDLDEGTVSEYDYDVEHQKSTDQILDINAPNSSAEQSLRNLKIATSTQDRTRGKDEVASPASPHTINRGPNFDTGIPKIYCESFFELLKYLWSTAATIGSLAVIIYGISIGAYTLPVGVVVAYFIAIFDLTLLFYLEGLMIAVVGTQYWNKETWKNIYPRSYNLHEVLNRPDNVKRFIIGRQFFTVLTGFLLAQLFSFPAWQPGKFNKVLFYIGVQSGLPGVLVVLAFGQLLPELMAAEFPLRFMNIPGSYTVGYMSLIFDKLGVGHAAWATYRVTKNLCFGQDHDDGSDDKAGSKGAHTIAEKRQQISVFKAEILVSSPLKTQKANSSPPVSTVYGKL